MCIQINIRIKYFQIKMFCSVLVLDNFVMIPNVPILTKNSHILPMMNKIYWILNLKIIYKLAYK